MISHMRSRNQGRETRATLGGPQETKETGGPWMGDVQDSPMHIVAHRHGNGNMAAANFAAMLSRGGCATARLCNGINYIARRTSESA